MPQAINNLLTGCAVDCDDDVLLPAIAADQGCTSYKQPLSQVYGVIIKPNAAGAVFASWSTTPTYVADSIDNTETDNTKAKRLVGVGGVAEPTSTEVEYPGLLTRDSEGTYVLEIRLPNMTDANYEFYRKLQCGWTDFTFWYDDVADYVFGSATGLIPSKVKLVMPKGAGNTDRHAAILRITWLADGDPERRVNPIA